MYHAVWEAMPELLPCARGRWCTDANPQKALQPSFSPRRSGGRDESASHMTVELCACARAMDSSRGGRKTLLPTLKRLAPTLPVGWGAVHTGFIPVHDSSLGRSLVRLAWPVTRLCGGVACFEQSSLSCHLLVRAEPCVRCTGRQAAAYRRCGVQYL